MLYNCHEKDHLSRDCPKKKCTHCVHKGHVEQDCRKKKRGKGATRKKKEEAKKKEERAPTKVSSSVLAALMAKLDGGTNMVLANAASRYPHIRSDPHIRSSYVCSPSAPNAKEECKVGVKPPSTMVLGQAEPNPFKLSIETSLRSHCMMVQKTPSTPPRDTQPKSKVKPEGSPESKGLNVLSLCDGMGCGALVLKAKKMPVNRCIGVQMDSEACNVCDATNPSDGDFPGVDHTWFKDVTKITEKDIEALGPDYFDLVNNVGFSMRRFLKASAPSKQAGTQVTP